VRASTGQILQRPPSRPQSSSGFRWLSSSIRLDILHKTEAGVVRLNLGDTAQVRTAYAEILASAKAYAPQARITGVSVQEMVGEGVEVIIGVSCDPQLGPVLLFGSGGVMVEVYNDVALRRCPITRSEAQAMIAEVKGARLLQGFRGRPAADLEALDDTLVRVRTSPCTLKDNWQSWTSIR
jgi:acetate---CoA ligase (ADP-forming)